ncbi:hypothetical protein VX037_04905 [Gordonia sp. Z-3]|jgi:hypothetical protein|uniref:Uncharacterized protein n=2 Tax=Gordonia TaxID=2053 RepID=A0A9X3D6N2_9ACTN|nr:MULTISPECIES: hypothetical protein [Gordonia]MCF3937406.1 hypothetical protein [Gordonia tangerina]MCX2965149.1 hypothetical protein [Gordonia aquimaris]MED5800364.1 hypothetical protein [Gordonia sp. Z-3]
MTVNDPIPSADDADLIEQSMEVDEGDDDYPATSHDTVSDETEAIAPVTPGQRH